MHSGYYNASKVWFCAIVLCALKQQYVVQAKRVVISVKFKTPLSTFEANDYDVLATRLSDEFSLINLGQIGELKGHYLFEQNHKEFDITSQQLQKHGSVEWHKKEIPLIRVKRSISNSWRNFNDELFEKQWHLKNNRGGIDCNVTGVWAHNITGSGVVVAIVDDGVEWKHSDLINNYCKEGSFDINSNDDDPSPVYDDKEKNKHGTECAGEVAAIPNNTKCGVGIAYGSKFSGIRAIDGPTTDSLEAIAFNKYMDVNDVYSCSWGPEDGGNVTDGPHALAKAALEHGVMAGRRGFGSIYVVASGNGGDKDNCNFDGYANSIYTITIAAINEYGQVPDYSESCTAMLGTTVSSGGMGDDIVTTDWHDSCTEGFSGTSAATPLVAGMVALMLEARPCLTWRDVQHIIAMTADDTWNSKAFGKKDFFTNKMGYHHSNTHGFGLLNAWKLVNAAKVWESVPYLVSLKITNNTQSKINVGGRKNAMLISTDVSEKLANEHLINTLEYILLEITIKHPYRGKLNFEIECPSESGHGTLSVIPGRKRDDSSDGFSKWVFSTVKCWGEKPNGKYIIRIYDKRRADKNETLGSLESWSLTLYGSQLTQSEIKARRVLVQDAFSGKYISGDSNFTVNCPAGIALEFDVTSAIQQRTLKLLVMISGFLLFWALYYSIEMTFCNSEDKEKADGTVNNNTTENTQPVNGDYGGVDTINNVFNNPAFTTVDLADVTAPIIEASQNLNEAGPAPTNTQNNESLLLD